MRKKFHVFTENCGINLASKQVFDSFFSSRGWTVVASPREADLVIQLTCANHHEREDLSVENLRTLRDQLKPGARLVVGGCLPKVNPERLSREFRGTVIDCRSFAEAARTLLGPAVIQGASLEDLAREEFHYTAPDAFVIVISIGCRQRCSFCGTRRAAGPLRSRPIPVILREVEQALRSGHRRIRLIADDSAGYGLDIGTDLAELLERLLRLRDDFDVEVWQLNPWGLIRMLPRLLPSVATGRIASIRTAFQSGNDRVLRWMRRPYHISDFTRAIQALRQAKPDLRLLTTVIAGFPGESETAFADTVQALIDCRFDEVVILSYSERPGNTVSSRLRRIPLAVIQRRMLLARRVSTLARPDILRLLKGPRDKRRPASSISRPS